MVEELLACLIPNRVAVWLGLAVGGVFVLVWLFADPAPLIAVVTETPD